MKLIHLILLIPVTLFFASVYALFGAELKKCAAALWLVTEARAWSVVFLLAGVGLAARVLLWLA